MLGGSPGRVLSREGFATNGRSSTSSSHLVTVHSNSDTEKGSSVLFFTTIAASSLSRDQNPVAGQLTRFYDAWRVLGSRDHPVAKAFEFQGQDRQDVATAASVKNGPLFSTPL